MTGSQLKNITGISPETDEASHDRDDSPSAVAARSTHGEEIPTILNPSSATGIIKNGGLHPEERSEDILMTEAGDCNAFSELRSHNQDGTVSKAKLDHNDGSESRC